MPIKVDKTNNNEFTDAFLSQQLFVFSEEYYITTRMLYYNYDSCFSHSIIHNGAECIEKIIKFYLSIKESNFKYKDLKKYGHSFDKLIENGLKINKKIFSDRNLINFSHGYSDLGNQLFRYGRNSDYKKNFVAGYFMDINKFIFMLDNIYIGILNDLVLNDKEVYIWLFSGKIAETFNLSPLTKNKCELNQKSLLKQCLLKNNLLIIDYLKNLEKYILNNLKYDDESNNIL